MPKELYIITYRDVDEKGTEVSAFATREKAEKDLKYFKDHSTYYSKATLSIYVPKVSIRTARKKK